MAEVQKGSEQSMDDILASIRRIISDDPLAPNPAGTVEADDGAALLGTEAGTGSGIASGDRALAGATGLRNPTDDLADILEPSKVPAAHQGAAADRAAGSAPIDERGGEQAGSSWVFDAGTEKSEFSGSLKDKLASLDGRGQPTGKSDGASLGDGAGTPSPSDGQLPGRENADETNALNAESSSLPLGNGEGEAETADQIQSVPGAIKLSDADVASIPSVQAVVEQTAADTRAEDGKVSGQHEPSEAASGREADVALDERSGAPETMAPSDGETVVSGGISPAAAPVVAATAEISSDGSKTLEALVSEALEPKLQQWLDANLPRLVEEKLQAEIERLARDGKLPTS